MATFYALIFVVLAVAVLGSVWLAIGTLLQRREAGDEIQGPAGVWKSRILWTEPSLSTRPVRSRVEHLTRDRSKEDSSLTQSEARNRLRGWGNAIFDEGIIWLAAAGAVIAVIASVLIVILLAVEIAIVVLIGTCLGGLRAIRAHPWTIEVIDPLGAVSHVKVKGYRKARARDQQIRQEIGAGEMTLAQLSDS